jgi:hypothetical protein
VRRGTPQARLEPHAAHSLRLRLAARLRRSARPGAPQRPAPGH